SSDGPRRMFFDPAGVALTPGNFSSSGGLLRQKPDLSAPDGVATAVPAVENGRTIFNPFFGTSAAGPHVAAAAALLKGYNPALTSSEIRAALLNTAVKAGPSGYNRNSGFGALRAD